MPLNERPPGKVYQVYGLRLRSAWPLTCPPGNGDCLATVELRETRPRLLQKAARHLHTQSIEPKDWFHRRLPDGSDYLRWGRLAEFHVSPAGGCITARSLNGYARSPAQAFLLSQALSFALLKQGFETLHATVIELAGEAIAFVGDCGYGKSTLAAAFLHSGARLLTDDLLVLEIHNSAQPLVLAHPGFPRIKLFPDSAKALTKCWNAGKPLMPGSDKLVFPLSERAHASGPRPLKAIYVLATPVRGKPRRHVTIRRLSQQRACLALIANTFNPVMTEPSRLARQFEWATKLATAIPVKSLSYPRNLAKIGQVVDAICEDRSR